ncbi:MAG: hypothetical protein HUU01_22060, partial [Saprospiraceae bacterium]|nr:hypothetical protein [Saprospiraceae bacterium]
LRIWLLKACNQNPVAAGIVSLAEYYLLSSASNYISGIEYNGAALEAVYHEKGRLVPNGTAWHYEYTLKDHLGNSRPSFTPTL